jgi:hypothetical protein
MLRFDLYDWSLFEPHDFVLRVFLSEKRDRGVMLFSAVDDVCSSQYDNIPQLSPILPVFIDYNGDLRVFNDVPNSP